MVREVGRRTGQTKERKKERTNKEKRKHSSAPRRESSTSRPRFGKKVGQATNERKKAKKKKKRKTVARFRRLPCRLDHGIRATSRTRSHARRRPHLKPNYAPLATATPGCGSLPIGACVTDLLVHHFHTYLFCWICYFFSLNAGNGGCTFISRSTFTNGWGGLFPTLLLVLQTT